MSYTILDENTMQDLYKTIASLRPTQNIKVGVNECIKAINKKEALLVVVAVDAVPEALIGPLPTVCELNGIKCIFVSSKTALGKACKLGVDVIACCIVTKKGENSDKLYKDINKF